MVGIDLLVELRLEGATAGSAGFNPLLDGEELSANEERASEGVPAAEAVRYLRELSSTWEAADGGAGRKMLTQGLFNRVDVKGFREVTLRLTEDAVAHGFGAVLPEQFGISVSGRGERI